MMALSNNSFAHSNHLFQLLQTCTLTLYFILCIFLYLIIDKINIYSLKNVQIKVQILKFEYLFPCKRLFPTILL